MYSSASPSIHRLSLKPSAVGVAFQWNYQATTIDVTVVSVIWKSSCFLIMIYSVHDNRNNNEARDLSIVSCLAFV